MMRLVKCISKKQIKRDNILLITICAVVLLISCTKDSKQNTITPVNADTVGFGTLNAQEQLFDNVHYAYQSLVYNGTSVAANGQSIGTIPDKKGTATVLYAGIPNPTITGVPPQLIDNKWLMFNNQPNTNYQSANINPINPPFEVWMVSRIMPGQRYESRMQGGGNALYLGDLSTDIRIIDATVGEVTGSVLPPNYSVAIERVVLNSNNTAEYWQNGVKVGTISTNGIISYNLIKTYHAIGVFTNSMDFDWAASYFKAGTFTSDQVTAIWTSLMAKWGAGSLPTNQILLSNIMWTNVNGTYTPSATITNTPAGVTVADPSKWDYEWYWCQDLSAQTLFSTKQIITTADFPAGYASMPSFIIKFRVRPKDTNGNTWRYFSGTFGDYTRSSQQ